MAQILPAEDLILDIVSRFHPKGASLEEIFLALSLPMSRRTLQYRLASLVQSGRLTSEGHTRGRRYHLSTLVTPSRSVTDRIITLSAAAEQIQEKVMRPIGVRSHVTYHREFLDKYQPNRTFYLSETHRKQLMTMGSADVKRPAGTYGRQIFHRILIDLSWNSSRLEGNTYSLLETERLLQSGQSAQGKDLRDTQMLLNHKAAIEFLVESAEQNLSIDRYIILNIHALLSDNLIPHIACGRLRQNPVGIGGSTYTPLAIPQLIDECFQQVVDVAKEIRDPFEQAFFLMIHIPYLQAFEDVNKRVSRLAANLPLLRNNLCPLSFADVPEKIYINGLLGIYEYNQIELYRELFLWSYERSCALYAVTRNVLGEPDPFRLRLRDEIKATVAAVIRKQLNRTEAILLIQQTAKEQIQPSDQAQFIQAVETELMALHAGSIARYRLRLDEYERWRQHWP